jgi:hypothetical protein
MPGLLRGVARTAVVAGTATAVSNGVSRRQSQRWAEQDKTSPAYLAATPPQAAPAAPAPQASSEDLYAKLAQIGQLRDQGILTEAEFEAQKAKLLAGV